jgi:hypothetical protein
MGVRICFFNCTVQYDKNGDDHLFCNIIVTYLSLSKTSLAGLVGELGQKVGTFQS